MDSERGNKVASRPYIVEFWNGFRAEVDLNDISLSAVAVKGKTYHTPLRFLEIYGNFHSILPTSDGLKLATKAEKHRKASSGFSTLYGYVDKLSWDLIEEFFMPHIRGVRILLEENTYQPPFAWRDCDARTLCINFTYNTNAIYRILSNLCEQNLIPKDAIDGLLDRACTILACIYKIRDNFIMKNMNNNFNMFLISKVIEFIVGKDIYDSECQELPLTQRSLATSLAMVKDYDHLDTIEKIGIALGKGVSFVEKRFYRNVICSQQMKDIQEICYQYHEKNIAIDDRHILLDMITNAGLNKNCFLLAGILDDATETVDDLLWMLDLMKQFPFFKVNLLVNTAQVSINFSSHMLKTILQSPYFGDLLRRLRKQFFVTEVYNPFISFQTNYLPNSVKEAIDKADAVYIKGANFFETCQIAEKDTFYGFVVYGPISQAYTDLNDYDAVFAYVPVGQVGYVHHANPAHIITLRHLVDSSKTMYESHSS